MTQGYIAMLDWKFLPEYSSTLLRKYFVINAICQIEVMCRFSESNCYSNQTYFFLLNKNTLPCPNTMQAFTFLPICTNKLSKNSFYVLRVIFIEY